MSLSREDVGRLADLARLRLTPEELEGYTTQLDVIFHHVDQLKEVDVAQVPPTSHVLPLTNVSRSDEPAPGLTREALETFAPSVEEGQFVIPKILE